MGISITAKPADKIWEPVCPMGLLFHIYENVESYVIFLVAICVPLGLLAFCLFARRHAEVFQRIKTAVIKPGGE